MTSCFIHSHPGLRRGRRGALVRGDGRHGLVEGGEGVHRGRGGAKNAKWSTIRSRANGGIPVTASEFAEASYGSALLARMGHYELPTYNCSELECLVGF